MLFSDYLTGMSVNAALNQPAYQVSTFGTNYAPLANDGIFSTHSCTIYAIASDWWAVDLSRPKFVRGVNVTNDVSATWCKIPVGYSSQLCSYFLNITAVITVSTNF